MKQEGNLLIDATNQPFSYNQLYCEKLQKEGIDLWQCFDAILTTYSEQNGNKETTE